MQKIPNFKGIGNILENLSSKIMLKITNEKGIANIS